MICRPVRAASTSAANSMSWRSEDDLAVLRDHAEAVAVAVEGQAQLGVGLAQRG